jgi:SH3-like domain-containing protein
MLAFAVVAVCSAGSWAKQTWWPTKIGVVTSADLTVLGGVHEGAVVRFVLHEGVEVLVVDEAPPWVQITIENGESGWVSTASVAIVEIK